MRVSCRACGAAVRIEYDPERHWPQRLDDTTGERHACGREPPKRTHRVRFVEAEALAVARLNLRVAREQRDALDRVTAGLVAHVAEVRELVAALDSLVALPAPHAHEVRRPQQSRPGLGPTTGVTGIAI